MTISVQAIQETINELEKAQRIKGYSPCYLVQELMIQAQVLIEVLNNLIIDPAAQETLLIASKNTLERKESNTPISIGESSC